MLNRKILLISIAILSLLLLISCGGKSKKINEVAQEESNVLDEEAEAKKAELPTTYIVEDGDKLWTVAEKPEIYGNKWQWPLIYDANRDILDTYDSLKEGQKLIIPRNVSAVEIEAAKERAMELGIPPGKKSVKVKEEEEEIAGLTEETEEAAETAGAGKVSSQGTGEIEEIEEEPTPIPEIPNGQKKGGINIMGIIIGLLLVLAVIALFLFYQKKKKEEEEEETQSGDTSSGSGGILT